MKLLLTTLLIIFLTFDSQACKCKHLPLKSHIKNAEYIFTGKVVELIKENDSSFILNTSANKDFFKNKSYTVKVVITERLASDELLYDTVEFTSDYSTCDPIYELGESYLFFAKREETRQFKMIPCSPWGYLRDSEDIIYKIRKEVNKSER